MRSGRGIFILFLMQMMAMAAGKGFAQTTWDSLYLRNGQVVFGELRRISLGMVQFKVEDLSEVSIKMSKIKTLKATSKIYRIETINKRVFFSRIESGSKPGYVIVGDSSGGAEIPLEYIGLLTYYSADKNLFEGNVSAGFNYTKSSEIGRINIDAVMRYIMKNFLFKSTISGIITSDNGEWYRERELVSISGTYLFDSRWKSTVLANYQRNRELGLESRFQEGLGVGYILLSRSKTRLTAISGIAVNQEKSFTDPKSNFTAEVPMVLDFDFFKFTKPEISIATYHNVYFSLTQKGRVRYDGEFRMDWKVISDFFVNLKFYYNFDNKPLSGSSNSSDYGTVFGISYKWD